VSEVGRQKMKLNQIMKQAQALQEKFKKQLEDMVVEASAGGGMVSVTMNGNKNVMRVKIDPEVVDKDDVEMLQDLVTAAVNEASRKVDEAAQRELGSVAGNIPGLF
jgi:DNA-binding YbaB/EbfC family protein